jgi:hypothetical protein
MAIFIVTWSFDFLSNQRSPIDLVCQVQAMLEAAGLAFVERLKRAGTVLRDRHSLGRRFKKPTCAGSALQPPVNRLLSREPTGNGQPEALACRR